MLQAGAGDGVVADVRVHGPALPALLQKGLLDQRRDLEAREVMATLSMLHDASFILIFIVTDFRKPLDPVTADRTRAEARSAVMSSIPEVQTGLGLGQEMRLVQMHSRGLLFCTIASSFINAPLMNVRIGVN